MHAKAGFSNKVIYSSGGKTIIYGKTLPPHAVIHSQSLQLDQIAVFTDIYKPIGRILMYICIYPLAGYSWTTAILPDEIICLYNNYVCYVYVQ